MGARWLYMLPALILSAVAVILALIGLAREPAPPEDDSADGVVMQVTEEQAREALEHSYWVATQDLSIGDTIGEDDFRQVAVSVPLAQGVDADTDITDKLLRRNVREGEILSQSHLKASNRLAQAVPAGFRAFAIGINNTAAVGGLLKPGDLVDVLAHFKDGQDDSPTAMIVLNGIEVLAVKGRIDDPSAQDEEQRRSRNSTAVLAIPREDLPRLLLADHNGDLRLAMAGAAQEDKDSDDADDQDAADAAVARQHDNKTLNLTTKLDTLFPEKKKPKRRAAPRGEKVEVYEGSDSRSTYVH